MQEQIHCEEHEQFQRFCADCVDALTKFKNKHEKEILTYQKNGPYTYIRSTILEELVFAVNKKIAEGFEPLGAPNMIEEETSDGTLSWSMYQFMIKTNK
jgi:hypothetical protein